MAKIFDFRDTKEALGVYYGGNAGAKDAIIHAGAVWMIKYPKTTRDMKNLQLFYTTSPLSEYLGSKIYETFGIPTHRTLLGMRNNKVVVACEDFTRSVCPDHVGRSVITKQLVPFHDLKNSFMSSDLESYSGTGSETLLDEVLATVKGQKDLKYISGTTDRFWDMFVVDAFIGNSDRNNGNWGILIGMDGEVSLAPVYDNGNAFFNKRSLVQMEKRLLDESLIYQDACQTVTCAYKYTGLDNEGHSINPFIFMAKREDADCNSAMERFVQNVNMEKIEKMINSIPEAVGSFAIMPPVQKEFYKKILAVRYSKIVESASR